jgi:hypothetical protein
MMPGPAGADGRRLERGLDGLGAGAGEDRDAEVAGRDLGEPLEQPHLGLGRVDVAEAVGEARGLRAMAAATPGWRGRRGRRRSRR